MASALVEQRKSMATERKLIPSVQELSFSLLDMGNTLGTNRVDKAN
jgi:hypothetical protein